MKKVFLWAIAILCLNFSVFSQLKPGNKMLSVRFGASNSSGSINVLSNSGVLSSYQDNGSIVSTEFSYSITKRKNLLFGAGLGFNAHFIEFTDNTGSKREGDGISVYPFAGLQKFISLKPNKIYYSPGVLAGIAFQHDNINAATGNSPTQSNFYTNGFLKIRPISVSFFISSKFSLGVEIGEYNFNIGSAKASQVNSPQPQLKQTNSQSSLGWNTGINVKASFMLK